MSNTLQPVQDGEQEGPEVPLRVAVSRVMSTRHTYGARVGMDVCLCLCTCTRILPCSVP